MPVKPEEIKYEPVLYKSEPVKVGLTCSDYCVLLLSISLTILTCYLMMSILWIAIKGYMGYE